MKDSPEQAIMRDVCTKIMQEKLATRPDILDKLLPDFTVGCRRPTPGNGFLEALCNPKTEAIFSSIARIDETGLFTEDGKHHEVDT